MAHARVLCLIAALAAGFAVTVALLPHSADGIRELVQAVGAAAPVILLAAWLVLTPLLFPGTLLAGAGGLILGVPLGAGVAVVGAVLGGLMSFALARTVAREPIERAHGGRFRRIRALLERRGFSAVLAARLAPGVPATALHYAAGLSRVSTAAFTTAMAIGAVVRTVPYAVLGAGLAAGSESTALIAAASMACGAIAAALLCLRLRRSGAGEATHLGRLA